MIDDRGDGGVEQIGKKELLFHPGTALAMILLSGWSGLWVGVYAYQIPPFWAFLLGSAAAIAVSSVSRRVIPRA